MPPAISDDEASDVDDGYDVPVHTKPTSGRASKALRSEELEEENEGTNAANGNAPSEEEEEDDDEGGEDDETYVVEKILDHRIVRGVLSFQVKWEGYDEESDLTWEPEEVLREGAQDILTEYLSQHGGREQIWEDFAASKSKKRSRPAQGGPSGGASSNKRSKRNGHPSESTPPRGAKDGPWQPPAGSWEEHIESIDACEDENSGKLIVFLNWKNGKKTKHSTDVIYRRCPQKMLRFYENHVRIVKHETAAGNDTAEMEAAVAESTGLKSES